MALRVKLEPDFRTARNGIAVLGAQVRLTAFGPGPSAGTKGQAQPATLIFCGAYLAKVREESNPALEAFAKVQGELELSGPTRQAAMALQGEEIDHDEPPPSDDSDDPPPYQLRIAYHAESFGSSPEPGTPLTVLRLPTPPEDARFFELGVELQIDGATEGGFDPVSNNGRHPNPGPARHPHARTAAHDRSARAVAWRSQPSASFGPGSNALAGVFSPQPRVSGPAR